MGWTQLRREPGLTTEQWFANNYFTAGWTIHASAMVGSTFYAAVESPHEPGVVTAFVALTTRSSGYYNWTYKDMDESMGPAQADCPARVLDKLTPTTNRNAQVWRQRCRDLAAITGFRFKAGDHITLATPLTFTSGDVLDTFTLRDRKGALTPFWNGAYYSISTWRTATVTVVRDGKTIETPRGARRDEDAYVAKVLRLAAARTHRDQVRARYGDDWHTDVAVGARAEYRTGDRWADLDDLLADAA